MKHILKFNESSDKEKRSENYYKSFIESEINRKVNELNSLYSDFKLSKMYTTKGISCVEILYKMYEKWVYIGKYNLNESKYIVGVCEKVTDYDRDKFSITRYGNRKGETSDAPMPGFYLIPVDTDIEYVYEKLDVDGFEVFSNYWYNIKDYLKVK